MNQNESWSESDFEEMNIGSDLRHTLRNSEHPYDRIRDEIEDPKYLVDVKTKLERVIQIIEENNITALFFLDKSARPISWLLSEYFRLVYPDKTLPTLRYLNYGREKEGRANSTDIEIVKNIFHLPSQGNILVVEEFSSSGNSLTGATQLLSEAFPSKKISSINLELLIYGSLPPKYKGVKDRNPIENVTPFRNLISARRNDNVHSLKLRALMKELAKRVATVI